MIFVLISQPTTLIPQPSSCNLSVHLSQKDVTTIVYHYMTFV